MGPGGILLGLGLLIGLAFRGWRVLFLRPPDGAACNQPGFSINKQ